MMKNKSLLFTLFIGSSLFVSCGDDIQEPVGASCIIEDECSISTKDVDESLIVSSKEVLASFVNNETGSTRSVNDFKSNSGFISLLDKISENDEIMKEFTDEEKQLVLDEELRYYDVLGYEDIIPNEKFAALLNSKGEI